MVFLPFILRRARRHWQTLVTLSLGVILATALLSSAPLLVDGVIASKATVVLLETDQADNTH